MQNSMSTFSDSVFSVAPIEFFKDDEENKPANCDPWFLPTTQDCPGKKLPGDSTTLSTASSISELDFGDSSSGLSSPLIPLLKAPSPLKVPLPSREGPPWMPKVDGEIIPVDLFSTPIDVFSTPNLVHSTDDAGYGDQSTIMQAERPSSRKTVAKLVNSRSSANRKKTDLKKFNPPPSNYSGITTLMIRGIPCSFSQEELLSLVASAGLGESCDFFYLPRAPNNASNLGYAFINFTETLHAWTCAFIFNGIRLNPQHSTKTCTVSPADIQGIPNLRKHFRRTAVSRGQNGPLFLNDKRNSNLKNLLLQAKKVNDEEY